jgi:hypothetical protein
MMDAITFSTHTEFCLTFEEFFDIFFYNNPNRREYARRVWEKMIESIGGTEMQFTDEVGFGDFKEVITSIKLDAENETYESESDDNKSESSKEENEEEETETAD